MPENHTALGILVGCTATGKTAVANEIARQTGAWVLSADSMLVYRGMDIGTAKPTPGELAGVTVFGLDLANPDEAFSVGAWLEHARTAFAAAETAGADMIVAGGTGLYVNALLNGIDAPPADPEQRARLTEELERNGPEALRIRAERLSPGSTAALEPGNNRRLIRLLECLESRFVPLRQSAVRKTQPVVGLSFDREALQRRIEYRARAMFEQGLAEEVARLRTAYPGFETSTAGKGIGYAEALAVLDGTMTQEQAMERTIVRTRQLAKRQNTWWRHQLHVEWIPGPADASEVPAVAAKVLAFWSNHERPRLSF
ncbi:MAG: tRNA (adenosine(37)-N6)-dimethylallyltransferase MiaA [Kiritimatiellia bacterium]